MDRKQKTQEMEDLLEKLSRAKGMYFTEYRGLSVEKMYGLRKKLRAVNMDYKVSRNNLVRIAMEKSGLKGRDDFFTGPTGIVYDYNDGIAPAKILLDFRKENDAFTIKGGLVEGEAFGADRVEALSRMPTREQLISMLISGLEGAVSNLVTGLEGSVTEFTRTLDAVKTKMEETAA